MRFTMSSCSLFRFLFGILALKCVRCQLFNDTRVTHEQLVNFFYNGGNTLTSLIPIEDQSKAIAVILTMHLYSVDNFNAVTGQVDISGSVYIEWQDETSSANIGNYDFPYAEEGFTVRLSPEDVWVPSVRLTNAVDTVKHVGDKAFKIRYHVYDGRMMWQPKVIMKVSCTPDVKYYPFDRQECSFIYTAWGYKTSEIVLDSAQSDWYLCDYIPNGVWALIETSAEHYTENDQSYMKFVFTIERQPLYYFINAVLPVVLLSILNGFVFLLPADSGERVSYAVTCFLAFVLMLQTVLGFLPQTADPMSLLCFYIVVMVAVSSLVCMLTILIMRLYHKPDSDKVPRCLQMCVTLLTCACCKTFCKRCKKNRKTDSEIGGNSDTSFSARPYNQSVTSFTNIRPSTADNGDTLYSTLPHNQSVTNFTNTRPGDTLSSTLPLKQSVTSFTNIRPGDNLSSTLPHNRSVASLTNIGSSIAGNDDTLSSSLTRNLSATNFTNIGPSTPRQDTKIRPDDTLFSTIRLNRSATSFAIGRNTAGNDDALSSTLPRNRRATSLTIGLNTARNDDTLSGTLLRNRSVTSLTNFGSSIADNGDTLSSSLPSNLSATNFTNIGTSTPRQDTKNALSVTAESASQVSDSVKEDTREVGWVEVAKVLDWILFVLFLVGQATLSFLFLVPLVQG